MLRSGEHISGEKRTAAQADLPGQTQPRLLPIELSDELRKAVDAKMAVYKNTPNFQMDMHSNRGHYGSRTPFMHAIYKGDYQDFLALVSLGADLHKRSCSHTLNANGQSDKSWTPLMMASYRGHLTMVDLLLKFGVNVNHESDFGYTAWSLAQGMQCKEIRQLLVEHGAEPDPPGKPHGPKAKQLPATHSSLVVALKQESAQPVNLIGEEERAIAAKIDAYKKVKQFNVDASPPPRRRTRLVQAIFDNDIIDFFALLRLGANVNKQSFQVGGDSKKSGTPLMMASFKGRLRMVKELLKRRVDPNTQSQGGFTALILAAQGNHLEVVKCLLRHGADIRPKTKEGVNVLEITHSYPEIYHEINIILKKHAESQQKLANAKSSDLICLIASAPDLDDEEALNNVVIHESSLNEPNDHGCTPLHVAVGVGSISFTKALLAKGAGMDARAFSGMLTPLHIAVLQGKEEIAGLLIAAKANPFAQDAEFKTPRDRAAEGTSLYKALEVAENDKSRTLTLEEILEPPIKQAGLYFSPESNRSSTSASASQPSGEQTLRNERRETNVQNR